MGKIARELGGIEAYVPTRVEQMMREKQGAYDTGAEEDFRD